jgi:hypothetical protein
MDRDFKVKWEKDGSDALRSLDEFIANMCTNAELNTIYGKMLLDRVHKIADKTDVLLGVNCG